MIKQVLPNGMLVLLKEIHTVPMISHWIWYRVGSRDERCGFTGSSHWVEHLQFKGTKKYPRGSLDRLISRVGGSWNALTYQDWTTYYEVLPADHIDLALDIESDRMLNSTFSVEDVETERTVIISERQGEENDPAFRLSEEVEAAAFRVHPYHHSTIGELADLQTMSRDDLYRHYRTYYVPNNAVLSIAGDFNAEQMLEKVYQYYASLPRADDPPRLHRPEPPQRGEKVVEVHGPGDTMYILIAYHVPQADHADFMPLMVLDSLLSGPCNLNAFGGGGISNRTSRLYRTLVEQDIASSVAGFLQATIDPYLYQISIILRPDANLDEAVVMVDEEIERIQNNCPRKKEIQRAITQAKALFAYGSESITNQAFWLGCAEMFASYEWYENYLERLAAVTPQDVQRVAQTYIIPNQRTVGIYVPADRFADDSYYEE